MSKPFLFSLLLLLICWNARAQHKDQMEFGFKGNVKIVTKRVYSNPMIEGDNVSPNTHDHISTYTYFFGPAGNIDSSKTEYTFSSGETSAYKTIYKFENSRRTEWVAINENREKLLTGKIKWASEKEYTESVIDVSDIVKYETTTTLNDAFRIIKIKIKSFDDLGNIVQDDVQEFDLDAQQNTLSYRTTHNINGQTENTDYKYLKMTDFGNPMELLMTKRENGMKTLIRMDYIYY